VSRARPGHLLSIVRRQCSAFLNELTLGLRQGLRLDQQPLSFIAVSPPAKAHHYGVPGAQCLDMPRQQRISGAEELEVVKTRTSHARRTRVFHHEKTTRTAAERLAISAKRSRFFSESSGETQCVR